MQSTGSTWKSSRLISCNAQPSMALRAGFQRDDEWQRGMRISRPLQHGVDADPIPRQHGCDRRDNPGPVFDHEAQIIGRGEFSAHILRRLHFRKAAGRRPRRCARSNTDRKPRRRRWDLRPLRNRKTPSAPHIAPWPSPDSCCPRRAPRARTAGTSAGRTNARTLNPSSVSFLAREICRIVQFNSRA